MVNGKDTKTNDPPPPQWVNLNPRNSRARWSSVEIQQLQQGAFTSELEHMENPCFIIGNARKLRMFQGISGLVSMWQNLANVYLKNSRCHLSRIYDIPSLVVQLFYTKLQLFHHEIRLASNKNVSLHKTAKKKKQQHHYWDSYGKLIKPEIPQIPQIPMAWKKLSHNRFSAPCDLSFKKNEGVDKKEYTNPKFFKNCEFKKWL